MAMTGRLPKTVLWLVPLALVAALALASCGPARPAEKEKVTVGYIPILICAPIYVALDKGYFEQEGLEVTLERLAGGADMLTQTAAGNFDVGTGGIGVAAFNAFAQGLDFKIVAPLHAERPPMTTPLVASKKLMDSGEVKTIQDLRGKKVAINARGAATEYWLDAALRKGGLTINDIQLEAIPFNVAVAALQEGSIAASMLGEPFATQAVQQGIGVILTNDFLEFATPTAVYYNGNFMKERRDVAERFLVAYLKAARDLYGDGWRKEENLRIIEKYTGVQLDVIKASAPPYHDPNGVVNLDDLQRQQEFFKNQGLLTYISDASQRETLQRMGALRSDGLIDVAKMVDNSFVQKAVSKLGQFQAPR